MRQKSTPTGFTLIELIIVIAIIGIIVVVGIHQFGNLRYNQAKKINVSTIQHTYAALQTYDLLAENTADRFDNFDSLIDISNDNGPWFGPAGTYILTNACTNIPGIYDGPYKRAGSPEQQAQAEKNNHGLSQNLANALGIYFLTDKDVELLHDAGIYLALLHNNTPGQATGRGGLVNSTDGFTPEGYRMRNGGPGFRADLSAFYPHALTNGSPVAIVNPLTAAPTYTDLGYDLAFTNKNTITEHDALAAFAKNGAARLLCFGIGNAANCTVAKNGLGEAPQCNFYNRTHYRSYLAVFALVSSHHGIKGSCTLAGVLDADGNTYRAAKHQADWRLND